MVIQLERIHITVSEYKNCELNGRKCIASYSCYLCTAQGTFIMKTKKMCIANLD